MGMDVSGRKPTTEAGAYFRNNVWWWRPLAAYVCEVAPEIASHCRYWQSNDGDGLNAKRSRELAAKLREEIAAGRTAEYAKAHEAAMTAAPRVPCSYCNATGIRSDSVGVDNGFTERVIPSSAPHPRAGQKGWCNGCDGRGTQEPDIANYPFSVENVSEFATFLEGCGGFKIW